MNDAPEKPAAAPNKARATMEKTFESAREAADKALKKTRSAAQETTRRTAEGIEANPLSVLVGGVALGVLAGALVPRTEKETKLLGPTGKRLTDTASGAVQAAKEAGKAELDTLGLTRNAARDQVGKLLDGVLKALATAGSAAVNASKTKE